jgi:hypothetical protein
MGEDLAPSELLPVYTRLLQDHEAEVRTAAAFRLTSFAQHLDPENVAKSVIPVAEKLCKDPNVHARCMSFTRSFFIHSLSGWLID